VQTGVDTTGPSISAAVAAAAAAAAAASAVAVATLPHLHHTQELTWWRQTADSRKAPKRKARSTIENKTRKKAKQIKMTMMMKRREGEDEEEAGAGGVLRASGADAGSIEGRRLSA
jgi:hypothetical protein